MIFSDTYSLRSWFIIFDSSFGPSSKLTPFYWLFLSNIGLIRQNNCRLTDILTDEISIQSDVRYLDNSDFWLYIEIETVYEMMVNHKNHKNPWNRASCSIRFMSHDRSSPFYKLEHTCSIKSVKIWNFLRVVTIVVSKLGLSLHFRRKSQ